MRRYIFIFLWIFIVAGCASVQQSDNELPPSEFDITIHKKLHSQYQNIMNTSTLKSLSGNQSSNDILLELDFEIKNELKKGKFIEENTSGMNRHFSDISNFLDALREISSSKKNLLDQVQTSITTNLNTPYIIHYISYKDFHLTEADKRPWKSYNNGMKLQIKSYYFRVNYSNKTYIEKFLVWNNPSKIVFQIVN